ncbi:MAG: tetratricopeptide (TPR) repeat protein [Planctomycetota bacterium]|jgi:tetratricopeptide (TPR) repeat protein
MHLQLRIYPLVIALFLHGCCGVPVLNLVRDCESTHRVPKENPYLTKGTDFIFVPQIVNQTIAATQEQENLFRELRSGLSEMAERDGLRLVTDTANVEKAISELPPSDFLAKESILMLGRLTSATQMVRVALTEWSASAGDIEEETSYLSDDVTLVRTDEAVYKAVVTVVDLGSGTDKGMPVKRKKIKLSHQAEGGVLKVFNRPDLIAGLTDDLTQKLVDGLSPYRMEDLLLYGGYGVNMYFFELPGFRSSKNLARGKEAAEDEKWQAALEYFQKESKRIDEDTSDLDQSRVWWNLAVTYRALERFEEAYTAATKCEGQVSGRERRLLVAELDLLRKRKKAGIDDAEATEAADPSSEDSD